MHKQTSKLDGFSSISRIIYYLTEYQANIAYEMSYFDKTNDEELYQRWADQYNEISELVDDLMKSKEFANKLLKEIKDEIQANNSSDKE